MSKQTLVIESPMELSLQGGMIVIAEESTGKIKNVESKVLNEA